MSKTSVDNFYVFNGLGTANASGIGQALFNVSLTYLNGSIGYETIGNFTQNTYTWDIDNCSNYTHPTLIMHSWYENNPTDNLSVTVDLNAVLWVSDPANNRTFNVKLQDNATYSLCLQNKTATYYADVYIKYTADAGFTHRYYLVNESLTNNSKTINLYNYNSTTGISDLRITARDKNTYSYFENVVASLQRNYLDEGVWRTVQMDESGDYGLIFFNIIEENTDYKIIFRNRDNHILKTTESMKFACTSSICELTYLLDPYAATLIATELNLIWDYDNETKNITISWSAATGETATVGIRATRETLTGISEVCDVSQSGSSGSYVCDAEDYAGEIYLSIDVGGDDIVSEWIEVDDGSSLSDLIGGVEGGLWSFGIMLTIIGIGLVSPAATVIAAIFGLIVIFFLGIFSPLTLPFIIIAVVLGIVVGIKVRN